MSLDEERKILISALEEAVKLDKEKFRGRGLLSTPDKAVLQKVRDAIEACGSYNEIAGHAVYTGGSAPVLTADWWHPASLAKSITKPLQISRPPPIGFLNS
jgi:hypothetical protein